MVRVKMLVEGVGSWLGDHWMLGFVMSVLTASGGFFHGSYVVLKALGMLFGCIIGGVTAYEKLKPYIKKFKKWKQKRKQKKKS